LEWISLQIYHDPEHLIHLFEDIHFMLFFVMLTFLFQGARATPPPPPLPPAAAFGLPSSPSPPAPPPATPTLTDAAAFFTNCLSPLTVVRLFGVFMGTLVLVNFALIVSYFPAVVVLTHRLGKACPCDRQRRAKASPGAAAAHQAVSGPEAAPANPAKAALTIRAAEWMRVRLVA
ncbi:MAG: hypothetical protein VX152_12330, partial [Pseudomonadota bacterium]|nr:hypothetical protein [Pseudomonadota bacterium]